MEIMEFFMNELCQIIKLNPKAIGLSLTMRIK